METVPELLTVIMDGFAAVGSRGNLLDVALGPPAIATAAAAAFPLAQVDFIGPAPLPDAEPVVERFKRLDVANDELWRLASKGRTYHVVAIDRPATAEVLFAQLTLAAPLLTKHGIIMVHPHADLLAEDVYQRQSAAVAAVEAFIAVSPRSLRRLGCQVLELGH